MSKSCKYCDSKQTDHTSSQHIRQGADQRISDIVTWIHTGKYATSDELLKSIVDNIKGGKHHE